ncbi:hypothetical protein [Granulicella sibirica]|uniref:Uncharacterized protein n=1 Tax=Granulicella sibirica TaxID=2479048 RepID=A0A4Q0T2J4_9BACT|nr:hypothetical protein [Granulicella sibirica]RXH56640.1 hypothetical protein GRAN_3497 [Granulicella sibirica]
MADPKVPAEDPTTSPEEIELTDEELSKVAGGRTSDPCEGGQFHSK